MLPNNISTSTVMTSTSSESFNTDDPIFPPEPILGDYVEMFTLVLNFIVGAPLNLAAYTQLSERPTSTRLDLLKRSLNYSDLLVLFIYVPSRACWLLTYDWRGGDALCKIVKMFHTFAFQLSYIIVISWVWINSRPSIRHTSSFSFHNGCDTVDTVLTRASEWNPLKTFSRHVKEPEKPLRKEFVHKLGPTTPRIVVSDETEVPLTQRPSISPSEASAVMRTGVHTSTSYNANLNRSRALRVSFLLVLAYIICWLPYNLISLIQFLHRDFFESYLKHVHFCQQLIIFNSVVNPYLYGFFGPHRPQNSGINGR
ncbi:hypothetical protein B9Z55_012180 [Caenorhabditis nigoni]|uniref:G-protein coupled receptors family 1 profile domain-containing protein n=1 Tax=Caenorhabditis nigoni TaxID=1611254 RepID=A0A2G5TW26_9PELO|nr:hypothetical protein B9Z55_012180 [Caenorhabditis nigoni]